MVRDAGWGIPKDYATVSLSSIKDFCINDVSIRKMPLFRRTGLFEFNYANQKSNTSDSTLNLKDLENPA